MHLAQLLAHGNKHTARHVFGEHTRRDAPKELTAPCELRHKDDARRVLLGLVEPREQARRVVHRGSAGRRAEDVQDADLLEQLLARRVSPYGQVLERDALLDARCT